MATELGKRVTYIERIAHIKLLNQMVIYHKEHCTKRSFSLRVSSVIVTKSAVSSGSGHIY